MHLCGKTAWDDRMIGILFVAAKAAWVLAVATIAILLAAGAWLNLCVALPGVMILTTALAHDPWRGARRARVERER